MSSATIVGPTPGGARRFGDAFTTSPRTGAFPHARFATLAGAAVAQAATPSVRISSVDIFARPRGSFSPASARSRSHRTTNACRVRGRRWSEAYG